MVRTYKRKTNHQSWSIESMEQAVAAVLNKEMGYKRASINFEVPQTTLENYVKRKKNKSNEEFAIDKRAGKYRRVFDTDQELELLGYLKNMEQHLFSLSMKDSRRLTYEFAERNGCSHRFNKETRMAGQDWMNSFLSRHTELSLKKPGGTSVPRAMGFNKPAVSTFFDLLVECVNKYGLTANGIYNCGKTNITLDPKGHLKVLATKGLRQIGVSTCTEHGETVTAEICFSAVGSYMPPMLICPRARMRQGSETGLPAGTWVEFHETDWMQPDIFVKWFKKFIEFSKASKESPVLLLLDGLTSHIKNLEIVDLARDSGVVLLCFPPHCAHKLQPLNVTMLKHLGTYFEEEVRQWMLSNPGKVVTLSQISSLFGAAFLSAATTETAVDGFRQTGIWPVDINVFPADDFVSAQTTDNQFNDYTAPIGSFVDPHKIEEYGLIPKKEFETVLKMEPREEDISEPCCSTTMDNSSNSLHEAEASNFRSPAIEIALLVPKVELQTSHDNDEALTEVKEERFRNERLQFLEEGSVVKRIKTEQCRREKNRRNVKASPRDDIRTDETISDDEYLYWISCSRCYSWAHNSCVGIESDDDDAPYVCELCSD